MLSHPERRCDNALKRKVMTTRNAVAPTPGLWIGCEVAHNGRLSRSCISRNQCTRQNPLRLLEIGTYQGGTLAYWCRAAAEWGGNHRY